MKVFKCVNDRINWVDYYKTFSIFLIVLGHSVLEHVQLIHFLYLFHVPLFFFISGYLEKTEDCNTKNYLRKTIYALVIPYFLWNILCVVFAWPITPKRICGLFVGLSLWNAASWFLSVLVIIKLVALMFKRHKNIGATITISILFVLFVIDYRMPYYANLAFMFMPFYFIGMFGKPSINRLSHYFENKILANGLLFILGITLLYICFKYTNIPHTQAVVSFTNIFWLYWLTGFLGVSSIFFLCISFNNKPCGVIQAISMSTLFIMCSHFEILQPTTNYITNRYNDIYTVIFVILFFGIQCLCIPVVMKYFPILAGRKIIHK